MHSGATSASSSGKTKRNKKTHYLTCTAQPPQHTLPCTPNSRGQPLTKRPSLHPPMTPCTPTSTSRSPPPIQPQWSVFVLAIQMDPGFSLFCCFSKGKRKKTSAKDRRLRISCYHGRSIWMKWPNIFLLTCSELSKNFPGPFDTDINVTFLF